jgi:hypothetical protein
LALIILQSGGLLLLSQFQIFSVQAKMNALFEDDETDYVKMILSLDDYLKSKVHSKEIRVQGEMYDVKSVTYSGNQVELMVIHDKHEGNILKRIKKLLSHSNEQKSNTTDHVLQLTGFYYTLPPSKDAPEPRQTGVNEFISFNSSFTSFISELNTPPPEMI